MPFWSPADASRIDRAPVWSPYLTLADLIGAGVPDTDANAQLGGISEPSPGVIRVTVNHTFASSGYNTGIRWDLGVSSPWQLIPNNFVLDGTWGVRIAIESSADPAAFDGTWVGVGLRGHTTPAIHGAGVGMNWGVSGRNVRRAVPFNNINNSVGGASSATLNFAEGLVAPIVGTLGGNPISISAMTPAGYSPGPTAVGVVATTASSAINPGTTGSLYRLFLAAGGANTGGARTVDFKARWAMVRVRPAVP